MSFLAIVAFTVFAGKCSQKQKQQESSCRWRVQEVVLDGHSVSLKRFSYSGATVMLRSTIAGQNLNCRSGNTHCGAGILLTIKRNHPRISI